MSKKELTGRVIEAESIEINVKNPPKPDCPNCHGTGLYRGTDMICPCRMTFSRPKKVKLAVLTEETPSGGVRFNMKEVE